MKISEIKASSEIETADERIIAIHSDTEKISFKVPKFNVVGIEESLDNALEMWEKIRVKYLNLRAKKKSTSIDFHGKPLSYWFKSYKNEKA